MNKGKKLRDVLPEEANIQPNEKAYKYLDTLVVKECRSGDLVNDPDTPFKHKYVYRWWELENGYAVGWNENPSLGWSFPVVRLPWRNK